MEYARIQSALHLLYGPDGEDDPESDRPQEHSEGRAILFSEGCPIAEAIACVRGCTAEEAEDVAIEVVLHLIHAPGLRFVEAAAWLKYLRKSVENRSNDVLRKRKRRANLSEDHIDPRAVTESQESETRSRAMQILKAADDHWLGSEPPNFDARRLAAKMLYVDGSSWTEARRAVAALRFSKAPETEDEMHAWLQDVRIVRSIAYDQIYKSPPELAAHIAGCPVEELPGFFEKIHGRVPTAIAIGDWTWCELSVIEHKFYCYRPTLRVHEQCIGNLEKEEVCKIIDRCVLLLPFYNSMRGVWKGFETHPARHTAFMEARFWKRLAFQFIIADGLPRNDFEEWLFPCADGTGYSFRAETLQGWIANKRLVKELREYLEMVHGEAGG